MGQAVAEHLGEFPPSGDLLFAEEDGAFVNRDRYNRDVWKPALRQAGIEPTRANGMHALRHHYASVFLEAGVSIRAVAEYLGHHDPGFTLRTYAHMMPASEDRVRRAVDAAFACAPGVHQGRAS